MIAVTQMEHHSNLVPWQMLAQERGATLAYVAIGDDGRLDLDSLDEVLARGPKLLAVAHVSNVLSTVNPIEEIARRAHAAGAVVLVDGAQAVPHLPVDVGALGADFYAWTGHKAYGPTGVGVLHGRRELLEAMPPWLGGGHMIKRVGDQESTYADRRRASRPGPRPSPRRSASAPPSTSCPRSGWTRCARTGARSPATRSSGCARCPASRSTGPPTSTSAAA